MKISEFVNLDEGFVDWAKKTAKEKIGGLFPRGPGLPWNRDERIRGEVEKEYQSRQDAAENAVKQKYLSDLSKGLVGIEASGIMTVEEYVKQFVENLTQNLLKPPQFDSIISTTAAEFARNYTGGGKLPAEAEKIWAAVDSLRRVAKPKQQKPGPQNPGDDITDWQPKGAKFIYNYTAQDNKWFKKDPSAPNMPPVEIKDANIIQKLNQRYSKEGNIL